MRDMITLNISAVCSYQLGQAELVVGTDAPEDTGLSIAAPDLTAGEEAHRVSQLETQMLKVENLLLLYNERLEMLETGRSDSGHNLRALEPPLPLGDASGEQAAARLALPNDSDGGALPSTSLRVRRAQQLPNNSGMVSQATSIQEGDRPKRLLPDGRAQPPNSRVRKS